MSISFVYIENDDCLDPAVNLAMEEYVLRRMDPAFDYMMFYRNEPSVIIGRNQNMLEEINDSYVRAKGVQVLRRLSGGGTVYHDLGNLNFSFVTRYEPSRLHNFRFFNKPIVNVLRSLGVPAEMNDRNDILADGRKISGNAQFSSRGRMFSHGTLLFDSKLDEVLKTLAVYEKGIRSKSHKSVRSVVANISEFIDGLPDIHHFRELLLKRLKNDGVISTQYQLNDSDRQEIRRICEERYCRWEWNIGRSPKFQLERTRPVGNHMITVKLEVDKGVIQTFSLSSARELMPGLSSYMASLEQMFIGVRYDPSDIDDTLLKVADPEWTARFPLSDFRDLLYSDHVPCIPDR